MFKRRNIKVMRRAIQRRRWIQRWEKEYAQIDKYGSFSKYPSEILVRMFKGNYIPYLPSTYSGLKILDVGAGDGNNLEFFGTLGFKLYATEISNQLVNRLKRRLCQKRIRAVVKVGNNECLPFKDNYFDFIVSWNVVHYCSNVGTVKKSIEEYCRVLRPGGFLFLSSQGLQQRQIKTSRETREHIYLINYPGDLRNGQKMFCFKTKSKMRKFFEKDFKNIKISRCFLEMMGFDWFILTAQKK